RVFISLDPKISIEKAYNISSMQLPELQTWYQMHLQRAQDRVRNILEQALKPFVFSSIPMSNRPKRFLTAIIVALVCATVGAVVATGMSAANSITVQKLDLEIYALKQHINDIHQVIQQQRTLLQDVLTIVEDTVVTTNLHSELIAKSTELHQSHDLFKRELLFLHDPILFHTLAFLDEVQTGMIELAGGRIPLYFVSKDIVHAMLANVDGETIEPMQLNLAFEMGSAIPLLIDPEQKGELASFDHLKVTYTLPNIAHFSYLQLKSWWKTQAPHPISHTTSTLTHFEKSIMADTPAVKPISTIYKLLLPQQGIKSLTCVRSWEKDLDQTLPEKTWLAVANVTRGLTFCASHLETTRKLFYRWYMVPTRLATMDPQMSSTCWRCKQEAGTFLHTWWKCTKLQPCWKEVISLIHQHTSITIPNSPKALLLLLWEAEYPKPLKYLILHILVAAQNLIAKNWLSPTNATMRELIKHLSQIGKFESSISRIPPNKSWRHEVWENWELKHPT
ncbi:Hypothetical predicted protein, partial [Pelobates cultripes]